MELWKTPKFLIIHLKRFAYYNNRWIKSNRQINFPLTHLDISPWLVYPPSSPLRYELYGCVNHYGRLGGGHYTAFGMHPDNRRWYCFDDNLVTEVEEPAKEIITSAAYLLFYKLEGLGQDFLKV